MKKVENAVEQVTPQGTFLCYGDFIAFEVKNVEGCPHGGFLGSEDVGAATNRIMTPDAHEATSHHSAHQSESELRYMGVLPTQAHHVPPQDFFAGSVFQVIDGFGFEAAGEPVRYGSQIKLRLKATGEVLTAKGDSNFLELISNIDYEKMSNKECNFRIRARYDTRAEGEVVYFHDLVTFTDYISRYVYCTSSTRVVMVRQQSFQATGFYVMQYARYREVVNKAMIGGDVVQLYHREERSFFMASPFTSPEGDVRDKIISLKQDEIVLTNSGSYWLIEVVSAKALTSGIVENSTPIRLRHLITGKYLSVHENAVCLQEAQSDANILELRLNFEHNSHVFRDFLDSATIAGGASIRIYHVMSKSYLILTRDLRTSDMAFTLSKHAFDKDVYQTITVGPDLVDIVQAGKKLYHSVGSFVKTLEQASVPQNVIKRTMNKASMLVKTLTKEQGYLNRDRSEYNETQVTLSFNACFELGMVSMLFKLAHSGFQRISKVAKDLPVSLFAEEEALIRDAYVALRFLLRKSKDTKRPDIPRDVVSLMVEHLTIMGRLGHVGNALCSCLPLTELIDAIHEDMMNKQGSDGGEDIMTPSDVEALLDFVDKIVRSSKAIPDPLPWNLLARVCNPLQGEAAGGESLVNKKMQMEICRQLLGSPFSTAHPGWSMFMYRTSLMPASEAEGVVTKPQFLVCTSPVGQIRPYVREGQHYSPLRPESLPVEECSEEIWQGAIAFRNSVLQSSDQITSEVFTRLDELGNHLLEQQYTTHLANLFSNIHWKTIGDLTYAECELFRSMLNLLASLCVGKNVWTQRVVRQLLPVDHLLVLLDEIKISTDSNMDKIIFLLPLKTSALHFLHECYINSAFITPMPASGKEGMKEVDFSRVDNKSTWEEGLIQECSTKVFSLFSQLDFFHLDLAADMSDQDLELYMLNMDVFSCIELAFAPEMMDNLAKLNFDLKQFRKEFPSLQRMQKLERLRELQELFKEELLRLCDYAVLQRRRLQALVENFVKFEAAILWESKIQTPILQLCCADKTVFGRSDMAMSIRAEEAGHMDDIREINLCMHYFNGMLRILRSLLLRQFFDPDYNKSKVNLPVVGDAGSVMTTATGGRSPKMSSHHLSIMSDGSKPMLHGSSIHGSGDKSPHEEQKQPIGKLNVLRELATTFMKMLGSWPGNFSTLPMDLSDDERAVEECFKRLFGYVKDTLGLTEGVVGIKLQCCNLLSVCLDILHVSTTRELRRIFDYMLECVVRHRKTLPDYESGVMSSAGKTSEKAAVGNKAKDLLLKHLKKHRKHELSKEEIKSFRLKVWTELHVRVVRNPDMIWNETLLFQQDTYQTLLKMVMYNNPQLRAEVLHLIFRINAHQSELATYISNEFKQEIKDDSPTTHYIKRVKFLLQTVFTRFDRFNEIAADRKLSQPAMEAAQRDEKLSGFLLQMKKLLLSNDSGSGTLGLIAFIFRSDPYPYSGTVAAEGGLGIGAAAEVLTDMKKAKKQRAFRSKRANNAGIRASQLFGPAGQELFVLANKEIDMQVPLDKIFTHMPNFDHQNALVNCSMHQLVIDFLVANGRTNVLLRQFGTTRDPCIEVIRLGIVFIRALIFQNEALIEKIVTAQLLSTLIMLRHLVQEALDFTIEILRIHPKVVEKITFGDFCTLVEDIRVSVTDLEAGSKHKVAYFSAKQIGKIIDLVTAIVAAEVDNSRERLNHFVSLLLDKEGGPSCTLLHRSLMLGLTYRLKDTQPYMQDFDVQQTCFLYQLDTNRISFSRMAKDVLADPDLTDEVYGRFKVAMHKWKLLTDKAAFKLHIELMSCIGFFARYSADLHGYLCKLFPSMKEILQVLMIDKYEIRIGYLKFLHGVWFFRLRDSMTTISKTDFDPETINYLRALFYSFVQDLRMFIKVTNDDTARSTDISELQNFPMHVRLLGRYLSEAVVPFLLKIIKSNLTTLLDSISVMPTEPVTSSNGTVVTFRTFQSLMDTLIDLIAELTLKDPSVIVRDTEDLATLDIILQSTADTTSHKLVERAENYVVSVEKAVSKSLVSSTSEGTKHEDWVQSLRLKCLPEFILEVDQLAKTNGYTGLTHLLKIGNPYHIYVHERELEIPLLASSADLGFVAQALHVSPLDIIRTPMNAATFRYTVKETSKMILAYASLQYPSECDEVMEKVDDLRYSVEQNLLPEFSNVHQLVAPTNSDDVMTRFVYYYEKWIKRGGVILEKLIEHMKYTLECFKSGTGLENTTASADDLCRCNAYWCNVFMRGLLRDRSKDITERYSEQTELLLALNEIEESRLMIMQNVFADLGSVDLVVGQFSSTQMRLKLHPRSVQLLQSMALGFGTAINEGGNLRIQRSLVSKITDEVQHAITAGNGVHFLKVARNRLRDYSRIFLTRKDSRKSHTIKELQAAADDAMELLRFFSLLCEGHNRAAQEYLGTNNLVSDIATFISDLGKVLAAELNNALITEEDIQFKYHPIILNRRRSMIKWVDPVPNSPESEKDAASGKKAMEKAKTPVYKFVDLDRISLLAKLMTSGLEALSEFCQGPRAAIQLIVARGGATKDFATFFNFFGAFHLAVEYNGGIFRNEYQKRDFMALYQEEVCYIATYQSLVQFPTEKLYWHGNDPLGSMLYQSVIFDQSKAEAMSKKPLRHSFNLKQRQTTSQRFKRVASLLTMDALIDYEQDEAVSHGNDAILDDIQSWSDEKHQYMNYRRKLDKDESEGIENNFYSRIVTFEEVMVTFEQSCLKFAMSLLEGSTTADESMEVARIVVQDIGATNLMCNMANFWERFLHYTPLYSSVTERDCYERDLACSYYSLVMRIFDTRMDGLDELKDLKDKWLEEYNVPVHEHIARIEVRYEHEKDLAVSYFPIPKIIKSYWDRGDIIELRENILFPNSSNTRDSADEKVKNFLKDGRFLLDTLRHIESLDENYAGISIIHFIVINLAHNMNRWSNLSTILSITINLLLIISVRSNANSGNGYNIYNQLYIKLVDYVGIGLVCSAGLSFCSYLILYGWLYVKLGLKNNPENVFAINNFAASRFLATLNRFGLLGREPAVITGGAIRFKTWTITAALYHFFSRSDSWYYMVLLSFAVVGYTSLKPTYAICMMEMLRVSKLMQYVSRAFTANIDQVAATVILAAIIIYLFVTFGFSSPVIHNQYNLNGQGVAGCYTLQACLRMHLDFGLLQSVLWSTPVEIPTAVGEIYNFLFTFIVQIVIPGLISGIIIDTFSEMRGNKKELEDDVFGNCFICNISRDDFEAASVAFDEHIKTDHNMWKYLWYLIYLDEKNHTEYDGIEQFCMDQPEESTRWLPIRKARVLSNMRERYDLFTLYTKITSLQVQLDKLHSSFRSDLNAQEKTIREIIKSENQDIEKALKDLEHELEEVRRDVHGEKDVVAGGSVADADIMGDESFKF